MQDTVPIVENHSDGFPDNLQLFRVKICASESQDSRLSVSTHRRPGSVQRSVSFGGEAQIFRTWIIFVISLIYIRYSNGHYDWMIAMFTFRNLKAKNRRGSG